MNGEESINHYVKLAQKSTDRDKKKEAVAIVLEQLKPFRYSLAKRFYNKGVDFDDIVQQIDLKLLEAIHDYDESRDPSALRHLVSKARNGVWNFYRKEMCYFDNAKVTISLDVISLETNSFRTKKKCQENEIGRKPDYSYDFGGATSMSFNEGTILDNIIMEEELEKLTPRQREVLLMCFVDDMTQYDIAEELQINQANVSRAKKRGLTSIKNSLNHEDEHNETL